MKKSEKYGVTLENGNYVMDGHNIEMKPCMVDNSAYDTKLGDAVLFVDGETRYTSIPMSDWNEIVGELSNAK